MKEEKEFVMPGAPRQAAPAKEDIEMPEVEKPPEQVPVEEEKPVVPEEKEEEKEEAAKTEETTEKPAE